MSTTQVQPQPADDELPPPRSPLLRWAVIVGVGASLVAAYFLLRNTPFGVQLTHDRKALGDDVQRLAAARPLAAAAVFVVIYLALAVSALPIAWWQFIGGFAFGLWYGSALSLAASTTGAVAAAALARLLAADYFHRRVEAKIAKLRQLDRLLGHNGFLVVMTSRLIHFLPFGLSNYAFGLLEISYADIFVGTLLGAIPATGAYVGFGAGYHPRSDWRFDLVLTGINLLLLVPLALRYTKPEWFKKVGLE
jgi:uncharacterized membrane protein YdjX (TVP38/TMEM64 family)